MSRIFKNIFPGIGSFVLVHKGQMVVFGDRPNDDLVVHQKNCSSKRSCLQFSGKVQKIDAGRLDDLLSKVQALTYSDAVGQFPINIDQLTTIKDVLRSPSATHLRFFASEGKLRAVIFNCAMGDTSLQVERKNSLELYLLEIDARFITDFSFTIKCNSMAMIPLDNYVVRVGDNSICTFTPEKMNVQYLFRDQELQEPLVTFRSPLVDSDIVFAPAPNF